MRKSYLLALIILISITLVGCASASSSGAKGEKITIKFSYVTAPSSPKGQGAEKFAELAKEYTDGKVEVELFPSGQLYGDSEELEALMSGNVQMVAPALTKLVALNESFQISDLPFFWENQEHRYAFWEGDSGRELLDSLTSNNIKGLKIWPNGNLHFTSSGQPLIEPADFKGLKFRIPSGAIKQRQYELLEAASVTIPLNESYVAMQQGTVDATENVLPNIHSLKYSEVQDYLTLVEGMSASEYVVLVNNEFWEELPEDIRGELEIAFDEATEYTREIAEQLNNESLEKIREEGGFEIIEMNEGQKEAFKEVLQPLFQEYEPIIGKELIEEASNLAK